MRLKLGPLLAFCLGPLPLFAQYAGPAILSRGEAPAAMAAQEIHFQPFVAISGIYDTGLAGVGVNQQGGLASQNSYGLNLNWGINGTHSWRHTKLGIDYLGGLNYFAQNTGYSSVDQAVLLGITHQLTRHVSLMLRENAGIFSRITGTTGLPSTVPFDPATTYIPTTDFFDNRTMYLTTMADITYQKTYRLSFDFGAGGFLVRRLSTALDGTTGAIAQGDVQYRVSRRATIGANYSYNHYEFTRVFGGSDAHGVAGTFAIRISRLLEFSGYAGFYRIESKFVQVVPIDPAIAALLGISQGTQIVHTIDYIPNVSARLSRTFQKGVFYVSGGHQVTPGNGLFLTSYATTVDGGYNYSALRYWSLGAGVSYMNAQSIGNIRGNYGGVTGSLTVSRQIIPSVHVLFIYSARDYNSSDYNNYNRLIHSVTVGVAFAPGDTPLRLW